MEQERYGATVKYPPDVLRAGRRPLLQFPLETLEATASNVRAIGIALRDRRLVAVAWPTSSAARGRRPRRGGRPPYPHFGESNAFYLQAMATSPTADGIELENFMLDSLRTRAIEAGFEVFSTSIEERLRDTSPPWFRDAAVLNRVENYLHSGTSFAYLQVALTGSNAPAEESAERSG